MSLDRQVHIDPVANDSANRRPVVEGPYRDAVRRAGRANLGDASEQYPNVDERSNDGWQVRA